MPKDIDSGIGITEVYGVEAKTPKGWVLICGVGTNGLYFHRGDAEAAMAGETRRTVRLVTFKRVRSSD